MLTRIGTLDCKRVRMSEPIAEHVLTSEIQSSIPFGHTWRFDTEYWGIFMGWFSPIKWILFCYRSLKMCNNTPKMYWNHSEIHIPQIVIPPPKLLFGYVLTECFHLCCFMNLSKYAGLVTFPKRGSENIGYSCDFVVKHEVIFSNYYKRFNRKTSIDFISSCCWLR